MRITDIYGQSVTIDGIALALEQVQRTGARLYGEGGGNGRRLLHRCRPTDPAARARGDGGHGPAHHRGTPAPVPPAPAAPAPSPARGRGEVTLADWAAASDRTGSTARLGASGRSVVVPAWRVCPAGGGPPAALSLTAA